MVDQKSNRHKTPHTYKSWAAQRRLCEEKIKIAEKEVTKFIKLQTFFSVRNPIDSNLSNNNDSDNSSIHESSLPSSSHLVSIESKFHDILLEKSSSTNPFTEATMEEDANFQNDVGLWEGSLTNATDYWMKKGQHELQHCDAYLDDGKMETFFMAKIISISEDNNYECKCICNYNRRETYFIFLLLDDTFDMKLDSLISRMKRLI